MVMVFCVGKCGLIGRNRFGGGGEEGAELKTSGRWSGFPSPIIPPHLSHSCWLSNHQIIRAYFIAQKIYHKLRKYKIQLKLI